MVCIISRYIKYKDNDAIVDAISKDGLVTFLAKGLLKTSCKNSFIKNTPSICEIEFLPDKYRYPILKNGKCLISPYISISELEFNSIILVLNEILVKCLQPDDCSKIYNVLYEVICSIKKGSNPFACLIKLCNEVLTINGVPLYLNGCSKCHKKEDIVGFSFYNGGFICRSCDTGCIKYDLEGNAMLFYREVCLNKLKETEKYQFYSKDNSLEIINKLTTFMYDSFGVEIKNIKLLN